jgi:acyl-coenzyme A synthetase/AMP-(fatty) acid ligase
VRLAVSAGEPLPVPVFDAVRRNLGLELVDGLGSSEATNLYLSNRPGRAIRGTVGYPVPGFALRVCDTRDRPVPAGEPGQLLVRGGSIMAGYFDNETATSEALAGGWLHTGDVVRRDDGGVYRFLGRLGDRFKSGGLWVDPHRVVGALGEHRDVAEVSVVGVPDDVGVVRVVAVVGAAGVDRTALEDELRDIADALLAPHERPRAYVIADELPTTASGKIRRDAVAVLAANALTGGSTVDVAP